MSDANDTNDSSETDADKAQDLRSRLKQFTQPLVDNLDTRLREQVDRRVDEKLDDRVRALVEEELAARLSVIERAIADIDRSLKDLQERSES
jgi:hypothetical protein